MSNSILNAHRGFFFGRRHRRVTVVGAHVYHAAAQRAKAAFWITCVVFGLLTAAIATSSVHPILALLLGAITGVVAGAMVWVAVRVWPVLQRLWWWSPEIVFAASAGYGFTVLADATSTAVTAAVLATVVGVPAAIGPVRRRFWAVVMCQVVRHRLRLAFTDFIKTNRHGTLPLILWARPTPAGERVWVFLRPGLSKPDLDARLDKLAVACWANQVIVERASASNAAFVRFDINRRDVLTATVESPLTGRVDPHTPTVPRQTRTAPTALDLPDVAEQPAVINTRYTPNSLRNDKAATDNAAASGSGVDDINDWI